MSYCSTCIRSSIEHSTCHPYDLSFHFSDIRKYISMKRITPCKLTVHLERYFNIEQRTSNSKVSMRGSSVKDVHRVRGFRWQILSRWSTLAISCVKSSSPLYTVPEQAPSDHFTSSAGRMNYNVQKYYSQTKIYIQENFQ